MKTILLIALVMIRITAFAQTDPKTQNYLQATTAVVGAGVSILTGSQYLTTPEPTWITRALGVSAMAAGATQLGVAGLSLYNANNLEREPNGGGGGDMGGGKDNGGGKWGDDKNPWKDIKNSMDKIEAQKKELENRLRDDLALQGVTLEDFSANPEKYLSPEERKEFRRQKEKMKTEKNPDIERDLASLFGGSSSFNIDPSSLDFNFGDFLKFQNGGEEDEFYGNVHQKFLKPKSNLSLFERASQKIKEVLGSPS